MGTHYKGTKSELDSLNVFIKLIRAADSVKAKVFSSLNDTNLTESQLGILDALYYLGPLNQRDIAKKLLKTSGNITMVVDNLEKQCLVKRERNNSDRRYFTVSITKQGTALFEKIFPAILNAIVKEINVLNEPEKNSLQDFCKRIGLSNPSNKINTN